VAVLRRVLEAPGVEGDTMQLVLGARRAAICLEAGAGGACPNLSYFPLLQYLPAGLVFLAGGRTGDALGALVWINLAAWLGTAVLLAVALRKGRGGWAAALALAAWVGSYGLAYANSSFGEILAGFLALAFTIGCAREWPWLLVGAVGLLAGVGKETAPPFLALLGASALLPQWLAARGARRVPWRGLLALLVAVGGGVAASAAFNVWRYGRPGNPFLLQELLRAPDAAQWLSAFTALWLSPNGGLLLFAPAAVALIGGAGGWAIARAARRADGWESTAPALGGLAVLVGMTVGLAGWYSPFGWWAWGPRLVLPWLPAALYLALSAPLPWERAAARFLAAEWRFPVLAVLFAGATVIHAAALVDPHAYLAHFTDTTCPFAIIQQDPAGFWEHISCLMWNTDRPLLGRMLRAALQPRAVGAVLAAALLQVALLWRAREWIRRRPA
jgi:hypothetical protein